MDLRGEVGRDASARPSSTSNGSASSRTTSATSPCRGRSWPGCPMRSRPAPRSSTASWWPPTTRADPASGGCNSACTSPLPSRSPPVPPRCRFRTWCSTCSTSTAPTSTTSRSRIGAGFSTSCSSRLRAGTCRRCTTTARPSSTATRASGLEGVVAKRLDSRYEPGKRTRTWLKVKVRHRQEMVVGGWLPGEGNRTGRIGALLVGYHDVAR